MDVTFSLAGEVIDKARERAFYQNSKPEKKIEKTATH